LPPQITEPVSSRKIVENISYECEWAFRYQFFAAGSPMYIDKPHFLA
jgi:hypothetical protein